MSTGSGQERSGEQNRLILRPSLCGAETYPAPPRRARRHRRTSATRAAKKTTGLHAATPGRGQKGRQKRSGARHFRQARSEDQRRRGRELPATFPQTRKPDLSFTVGSPAPRASSKGSLSRRVCMSEAPSPQARSEGSKATRLGGIRQKWAGDGSAPQARSAHPQRIAASRKQEARALTRLSGRHAEPRVSIRSSGQRQTRATWWSPRPVPSSRRCRLHAAPQCAGKCTVRGRSPYCPWWRKTDRKSSSGSLR